MMSDDDLAYVEAIVMGETPSPALAILTERLRIRNRELVLDACSRMFRAVVVVESRYRTVCDVCRQKLGSIIHIRPGVFQQLPPFDNCQSPHQLCLSVDPYCFSGWESVVLDDYLDAAWISNNRLRLILDGALTTEEAARIADGFRESSIKILRDAFRDGRQFVWVVPSGYPDACEPCLRRIGECIVVGPGAGQKLPPYPTCQSPHKICLMVQSVNPGRFQDANVSRLQCTSWYPSPITPSQTDDVDDSDDFEDDDDYEPDDLIDTADKSVPVPTPAPAPKMQPYTPPLPSIEPQSRQEWSGLLFVVLVFAGMILFLLRGLL